MAWVIASQETHGPYSLIMAHDHLSLGNAYK